MKKCAITSIIFSLLILGACTGGTGGSTATGPADVPGNAIEFTSIDTTAVYAIDTLDKASPRLEAHISLPFATGSSAEAGNINASVIYAAFGLDSMAPSAAIATALTSAADEYLAQRPHYLNEKSMQHSPAWFNHRISINGTTSTGLSGCINYTIKSESYSGGAHGYYADIYMNFDPTSGQEIKLCDIFTVNFEEPLSATLIQALGRELGATTPEQINEKGYFNIRELYPTENFLLAADSIIFLYNPYDIAPYSTGQTRIAVGYNELQGIIKK